MLDSGLRSAASIGVPRERRNGLEGAADTTGDVINRILGVGDNGPIAALRNQKPILAKELQAYYRSLFQPEAASAAALPLADRYQVAVRVASHTGSAAVAAWYATLAGQTGIPNATIARLGDLADLWDEQTALGAAIRHADLLTTRPGAAQKADLTALTVAGYSPAGILSLAQTIAFVSYQLRLIAGLRALGELA